MNWSTLRMAFGVLLLVEGVALITNGGMSALGGGLLLVVFCVLVYEGIERGKM